MKNRNLQAPAKFEVFTAAKLQIVVLWDVMLLAGYKAPSSSKEHISLAIRNEEKC